MVEIIIIFCLFSAFCLLLALALIDLKHMLLPDKLVLPFLLLGIAFHISTVFYFSAPLSLFIGFGIGGGLLYLIRFIANRLYNADALGLGDVKLMAAAGLWLGAENILMALTLGALAGIIHGLGLALHRWKKTGKKPDLGQLSVPAGPGFIIGIILMGFYKFYALPEVLF